MERQAAGQRSLTGTWGAARPASPRRAAVDACQRIAEELRQICRSGPAGAPSERSSSWHRLDDYAAKLRIDRDDVINTLVHCATDMSHVEAMEESLDIGMPRWREDAELERQVADRDWCVSQLTGEIIRLKESAEIDAEALGRWFAVEVRKLAVLVGGSHWVDVGRGKLNGSQAADRGAVRHGLPAFSAAFEVPPRRAKPRRAARRQEAIAERSASRRETGGKLAAAVSLWRRIRTKAAPAAHRSPRPP